MLTHCGLALGCGWLKLEVSLRSLSRLNSKRVRWRHLCLLARVIGNVSDCHVLCLVSHRVMHDEVSDTENIRKNLAIERMIVEGCDILLDTSQTFIRQGKTCWSDPFSSDQFLSQLLLADAGARSGAGLCVWCRSCRRSLRPWPGLWLRPTSVLFLFRGHEKQQHNKS